MDSGEIIAKPVFANFHIVAAILKPFYLRIAKRFRGSAILDAAAGLEGFALPASGIIAAPIIGMGGRQS